MLDYKWLKLSKMDNLSLTFMESQVNLSFISYFSSFINEMCDKDYTNNFTIDQIFSTRDELIQWVRGITFHLGFVVVTIRFDKATGQPMMKTYVLLDCERGGKYRKYKSDVQPSVSGTRKCDCPFKLTLLEFLLFHTNFLADFLQKFAGKEFLAIFCMNFDR